MRADGNGPVDVPVLWEGPSSWWSLPALAVAHPDILGAAIICLICLSCSCLALGVAVAAWCLVSLSGVAVWCRRVFCGVAAAAWCWSCCLLPDVDLAVYWLMLIMLSSDWFWSCCLLPGVDLAIYCLMLILLSAAWCPCMMLLLFLSVSSLQSSSSLSMAFWSSVRHRTQGTLLLRHLVLHLLLVLVHDMNKVCVVTVTSHTSTWHSQYVRCLWHQQDMCSR